MDERPTIGDWPTVPGYEILKELGRGGMGVVYLARQLSLDRLVALKVLRDGPLAGSPERARFRIEAEAAARMRHPNIVEVYEVGEYAGRPFLAMEFLDGGSLDRALAGRPQPAAHAAALSRILALAMQHAHTHRVVHRDLKPANILLKEKGGTRKDEPVVPKITDFGLAKRLDSDSTAWTRDGAVLGTASYMAPEQAAGRVRDVGPAVDVYALGAILYEMLTGRPPFQGESLNETLDQVLYDEPMPPTRLQADVPRDLETICLKCLEKDPSRRYEGAGELAADLERFLEGRTVAAVPLAADERLARFAARDGYQLTGEIGRGPHSIVYRALHDALKQPVAVKVFAPGSCTRDAWEARLRLDAELRAGLAHPQIVPVQRGGWWDDAPYLAIEFVPHGTLADRLKAQSFTVPQALRLVEQLGEIVSYLHRQGVVHANLKPSNVLFAADGIPRLTDLRTTGSLFQQPFASGDADPAGICYLTPEAVRDPAAEPRLHADIYGLGLILYELLTGRAAFAAGTVPETLEQVGAQEPTPPSRLNSEVPPAVEAVCLRCLRKNPWRRYARAYDLIMRLRHLQEKPETPAPSKRRSAQDR